MNTALDPDDPHALAQAAQAGDADAAHRLAVLAAMGLGLPQDWREALERLRQAGDLGHATAERQLALLSSGAAFDIAAWLNPPAPRMLSQGPAIFAFEGFLPDAVCDWLKDRATTVTEPALVYDPDTGAGRRESVRTNAAAQFALERMDLVLAVDLVLTGLESRESVVPRKTDGGLSFVRSTTLPESSPRAHSS